MVDRCGPRFATASDLAASTQACCLRGGCDHGECIVLETPTSTKELVEVCDAGRSTIISVATALLTHAMKPLLFVVVLASTTEASHDERRKLTFTGISAFSPANVNRNYTHYATALHTDLIGDASGYDRTVPASVVVRARRLRCCQRKRAWSMRVRRRQSPMRASWTIPLCARRKASSTRTLCNQQGRLGRQRA